MILLVDSGSTKCDWIAVDKDGNQLLDKLRTKGLNPAILAEKKLKKTIKKSKELSAHRHTVTHVFFYGAGCGTENPRLLLKGVLNNFFPNAEVEVNEDTLAAVYATVNHKNEAAVVCIQGTGSNCSYYDGENLHQRVDSLGYSLMDDASGNYFGRQLLRDYKFNNIPSDLATKFGNAFDLSSETIKNHLYKNPNPNTYLATFARFLIENKDHSYCQSLIKKGLSLFIENQIFQYDDAKEVTVHFVGSIAFYLEKELSVLLDAYGLKKGKVLKRPIDGLVLHHKDHILY